MTKPDVMLCMAAADCLFMVGGSATNHVCGRCGTRVLMAPSSLKMLAQWPDLPVICSRCAPPAKVYAEKADEVIPPTREQMKEFDQMQPNPYSQRN